LYIIILLLIDNLPSTATISNSLQSKLQQRQLHSNNNNNNNSPNTSYEVRLALMLPQIIEHLSLSPLCRALSTYLHADSGNLSEFLQEYNKAKEFMHLRGTANH
jgi:predicted nuclease of restriction endonuclease-like (RecB) superfamily